MTTRDLIEKKTLWRCCGESAEGSWTYEDPRRSDLLMEVADSDELTYTVTIVMQTGDEYSTEGLVWRQWSMKGDDIVQTIESCMQRVWENYSL